MNICHSLVMMIKLRMLVLFYFLCTIYRYYSPFNPEIVKINLQTSENKKNLKIIQLSDFHFEKEANFYKLLPEELEQTIQMVNASKPDIIFLTGDFVDKDQTSIIPMCEYLKKLNASIGIYAVMGNHDGKNPKFVEEAISSIGFTVLANKTVVVNDIEIVGVHDYYNPEFDRFKELKLDPQAKTRLILSHTPDTYLKLKEHGWKWDMMFSGHSHNGQICLPNGEPLLKYMRKILQFSPWVPHRLWRWCSIIDWDFKAENLHVNRGLGSHAPGRIFCRPEITMAII